MKIAVLWGTIFGILQAVNTIVLSYIVTPNAVALQCIGLLITWALNVACSLIAAFHGKAFGPGFWAGVISLGFDLVAGLVGYRLNPDMFGGAMPAQVVFMAFVLSYALSIGVGLVLSASSAGIGYIIYRDFIRPKEEKSLPTHSSTPPFPTDL